MSDTKVDAFTHFLPVHNWWLSALLEGHPHQVRLKADIGALHLVTHPTGVDGAEAEELHVPEPQPWAGVPIEGDGREAPIHKDKRGEG